VRQQRISPAKFAKLQQALVSLEAEGYAPEAAILVACAIIRIDPPSLFEGVELVVDWNLEA